MDNVAVGLRVDLGCGSVKKTGTIGVDIQNVEGVDYVLDIEREPLPFRDRSVIYLHSSHFLEHVADPARIFAEISRVCADKAKLELWTPYAGSNPGFILGHKVFFTEDIYLHMCTWFVDFWQRILGARWVLQEFQYVIEPGTLCYLKSRDVSLDFALRHLRNIADEFCAHITVLHHNHTEKAPTITRTFSVNRFGPRYQVKEDPLAPRQDVPRGESADKVSPKMLDDAICYYAQGGALPPF